jgi:hypothetical protein
VSDVDGGTVPTRPDGLAGAPDVSQPHERDGLPPIPVQRPDRARRVRSFVALMTGYAAFFIWVAVVGQRVGRDPSLLIRNPATVMVVYFMIYFPALILWLGSAALWKTARPGVEKSSRRAPTVAMYVGSSVGIVLGLLFSALNLLTMGWVVFPQILVVNLVVFPLACLFLAAVRFKEPGKKLLRASWPRLSIRSLLAIIAYVCLLLGLGVTTTRVGQKARLYQERFDTCDGLLSVYEREGRRVPAVAPGFRKIIEYLTPIAAKYDRARKEPWIDVPPDPPFPVAGPPVLPWR